MIVTVTQAAAGWSVTPPPAAGGGPWARGADAYDAAVALARAHHRRGGNAVVRVAALGSSVDVLRLVSVGSPVSPASAADVVSLASAS